MRLSRLQLRQTQTYTSSRLPRIGRWFIAAAAVLLTAGCGGPATLDPVVPPQSANAYWVGVEVTGAVHLHIDLVQTGTALSILPNCQPDRCALFPFNASGVAFVGSDLPVVVKSFSGSFTNPTITFTFTLSNNRTFTFTGRMADDLLMTGKISGATLPETTITFQKSTTT
jgi:hypothetical protein